MECPTNAIDELIEKMGLRPETVTPVVTGQRLITYDPLWKLVSASLRVSPEGVLSIYLKLPSSALQDIVMGITYARAMSNQDAETGDLPTLHEFLQQELAKSMAKSIFLRIPAEEVERGVLSLEAVSERDKSGSIRAFVGALKAGLRNDPAADWITRCGGPAYVASDTVDPTPQSGDAEISGLPE